MSTHNTKLSGFSLIEMMVGLAIGLLGLLAVTQVMVTFNKNRNATTQTIESQSNGTMALYLLERDIAQAGYNMQDIRDNCPSINWYYGGSVQTPLSGLPLKITDGGTNSDSIKVQYASSTDGVPFVKTGASQLLFTDDIAMSTLVGYQLPPYLNMLVVDVGGVCSFYQQTGQPNNVLGTIPHAPNTYNPVAQPTGWPLIQVSNLVSNLGSFVSKTYSIQNNNLMLSQFPTPGNYLTAVDGIVYLKAQYGLSSNPPDGTVHNWVNGTTAITNTNAKQVIAIRIGLIASTTGQVSTNPPSNYPLLPAITDDNGTQAAVTYTPPTAATGYRYKSYYTVIPLRNVIWN